MKNRKVRTITKRGYVRVAGHFDHPRNDYGFVSEHVLVYEQSHKCCMLRWSVVHHINHNQQDNRIENLQGMTYPTHLKHHRRERQELKSHRICSLCSGKETYKRRGVWPVWYHVDDPERILCSHCYDHSRIDIRRFRRHEKIRGISQP